MQDFVEAILAVSTGYLIVTIHSILDAFISPKIYGGQFVPSVQVM